MKTKLSKYLLQIDFFMEKLEVGILSSHLNSSNAMRIRAGASRLEKSRIELQRSFASLG